MLDAHQLLWTQIAAGVCLLLFGATLFNLLRLRGRMQAASHWGTVEGAIIVSRVDQPPSHLSDDLNDATPVIRYRYRARGRELESGQVALGGPPLTTRVRAGQLVARYPVGARVDVHVDPDDAGNTLLEPLAQGNLAALTAFTVTFGCAAAILTAHAIAGHVLYSGNGVPLFAFAFPILALLGATMAVTAFVRGQRLASASLRWPTTSGTITASSVIEETIEDKRNDDKALIRMIHRYQVDLRYAYQVAKRDYVGTSASWGWTAIYGLRELAEKAASQYREGQPVTVYYDPGRPGHAVLEPDNRKGSLAPLIFSGICAVFALVFFAFFITADFRG